MYGELIPYGGGDPIPLVKPQLLIGRRESCDIVLRFGNVSAHHCEMTVEHGYWFIRDLNSQNGTKVNGLRVTAKKRIDPGDRLAIAKHTYEVHYSPTDLGAEGPPPDETALGEILSQSLMKSAGLERKQYQERGRRAAAKAVDDQFFDDLSDSPASASPPPDSLAPDSPTPSDSPTPPVATEDEPAEDE
jgi:pSer/pThr/pTyr-binding forkhead associated (FHA) protein